MAMAAERRDYGHILPMHQINRQNNKLVSISLIAYAADPVSLLRISYGADASSRQAAPSAENQRCRRQAGLRARPA